MGDVVSVYVTMPDKDHARAMAHALVEAGLVACANIVQAESVYRYEGVVVDEPEVVMFLKTRRDALDATMAEIERLHPYDVPCIVAFDVEKGHAPYLDWVKAQVRGRLP